MYVCNCPSSLHQSRFQTVEEDHLAHRQLPGLPQQLSAFAAQTLRGFRANQGLLLAGAVAYYALLSIVPLLILTVIGLSYLTEQAELLVTIERYLEWLVPGQSEVIVAEPVSYT